MKLAVVVREDIRHLPPILSLLSSLSRLGQDVTLVTGDASPIQGIEKGTGSIDVVEYGGSDNRNIVTIGLSWRRRNAFIRDFLIERGEEYDVVWIGSDITARNVGNALGGLRYILQLHELIERVPLVTRRGDVPLSSSAVPRIARGAWKVVVPEYNRAHIQAVYWDLPRVPFVLPNKPAYQPAEFGDLLKEYEEPYSLLQGEKSKVMLYQGAFGGDRDMEPFADAVAALNGEYALYLMGSIPNDAIRKRVDDLCSRENVHYLGFVDPPYHLRFTELAYVGLMPYTPGPAGYLSRLNALYCAPNKIWEYTRKGVPVVASDVPGLRSAIEAGGFGATMRGNTADDVCAAVREVESRHAEMSSAALSFYQSVDYDALVAEILEL